VRGNDGNGTRVTTEVEKAPARLQELVAEVDTGARRPVGVAGRIIFGVALAWALFQTWYPHS